MVIFLIIAVVVLIADIKVNNPEAFENIEE